MNQCHVIMAQRSWMVMIHRTRALYSPSKWLFDLMDLIWFHWGNIANSGGTWRCNVATPQHNRTTPTVSRDDPGETSACVCHQWFNDHWMRIKMDVISKHVVVGVYLVANSDRRRCLHQYQVRCSNLWKRRALWSSLALHRCHQLPRVNIRMPQNALFSTFLTFPLWFLEVWRSSCNSLYNIRLAWGPWKDVETECVWSVNLCDPLQFSSWKSKKVTTAKLDSYKRGTARGYSWIL